MKKGEIVEFIGLPGSGKSTAARFLLSKHFIKRSRIDGRSELLFWNIIFCFRYPNRFIKLFLFVVRNSPSWRFFYYKFTNMFLQVNAKHIKAKYLQRAFIDQGFVQNSLSLFEVEVSKQEIAAYLRHVPLPDEIVVFDTPIEIRKDRMSKRDFTVRDMFDPEYKKSWEQISEKNFRTLLQVLPQFVTKILILPYGEEHTVLSERYSQKKLAYVANFRLPTEKAHGYQIAKMCESFGSFGLNVQLILPTKKRNPIKRDIYEYYGVHKNFSTDRIFTPDFFALKALPPVLRFLLQSVWFALKTLGQKIDPEAIYYLRNPELVWIYKQRGATRVIFEAHMLPKKKWLYKKCIENADGVACNSRGTMTALEELGLKHLALAPNGVDLEAFAKAPQKNEARKILGLPHDKTIILYSGHLYAWKGVQTLIEAAKLDTSPNNIYYVVGGAQQDIDKLKPEDNPRIVFTGHVPHDLIPSYLKAADILVLPNSKRSEESVSYTSPIKMFEYMASGTPIITSDLPSIREILDEESALFFEPENALDLKDKISTLLNDRAKAKLLVDAAYSKAQKYTWTERAKRILSSY